MIMKTAKVFISGNSQAVRLPKEYRFTDNEVIVKKIGDSVMLLPKEREWEVFLEGLNNFTEDIFSQGRMEPSQQERESL